MKETSSGRNSKVDIKPNLLDRAIAFVSPVRGAARFRARAFMALGGAYLGGSKTRRAMSEWATAGGDADSDISPDLPVLRERSRDLIRNNALAAGAINTKVTSVVGSGLLLKARIDSSILGISEDEADKWEKRTEAEFRLWSENPALCDVAKTLNFAGIQELTFRSVLENGDCFISTPTQADRKPYQLQLQMIEADRVCNADNAADSETLCGGVEKDKYGAPVRYHVLKGHPGNIYSIQNEWVKVDAFGSRTGRRNVLHLYHKKRIGQSRGVPDLAPVIEKLKQLGDYTSSEAMAAVVASFFTVFIKSEYGGSGLGLGPMEPQTSIGGKTTDKEYKMGSGAILDLNPGESIETANPGRPNDSFDPFVLAMSREIGVALELPFEILIKHFTASYSAARAAMLEAWRFFMGRRKWLADSLCRPVYELWMIEAVANGRIVAPGFLNGDPLIRQAFLGAEWTGPARGQIDEKKEVDAAQARVNMGVSTLSEETSALTGGDWELKHPQRVREVQKRREAGLEPEQIKEKDNENMVSNNQPDEEVD